MMEDLSINTIIEPHLNANGYKFLEHRPAKTRQNDFIRLYKDDTVLLGFSNMTSREWDGGAYITSNIQQLKEQLTSTKVHTPSIQLPSGASDGVFIESSDRVLLAEDSGSLSIWKKSEGGDWSSLWSKEMESEVHDGGILTVACFESTQTYVTGSEDTTIKIWDIEDFLCKHTYNYNKSAINDVSTAVNSNDLFVSAASDGSVCLWDNRCQALVKKVTGQSEVRCVQFVDENCVMSGNEGGLVELLDIRNEITPLKSTRLPHPLHRLYVQHSTKRVAACGESTLVTVFSGADLARLFTRHVSDCDSVRALVWDHSDRDLLHVAARDGTVCSVLVKS